MSRIDDTDLHNAYVTGLRQLAVTAAIREAGRPALLELLRLGSIRLVHLDDGPIRDGVVAAYCINNDHYPYCNRVYVDATNQSDDD